MLKEFVHIKQENGKGRRRWFDADAFELIVWLDAGGAVEGYQICYDLGKGEHALTWRPEAGFAHNRVDSGDMRMGGNAMTPILLPDGKVPWGEIAGRFEQNAASLEPELRELVRGSLAARR